MDTWQAVETASNSCFKACLHNVNFSTAHFINNVDNFTLLCWIMNEINKLKILIRNT